MDVTATSLVLCITIAVICVTAFIGNIAVLTAIIKNRRLHTTSNVYICALAFTDIYITITHPIKYIMKVLGTEPDYILCGIIAANTIFSCFSNLMIIEIISIDRFYAIYWPFQYRKYCTKSRATKVSVIVSILSIGIGGVVFAVLPPRSEFKSCWSGDAVTVPIVTLMTAVTCCIALELTVMYGAMFYKAVEHQRRNLSIGYFSKHGKDMSIFDIKALKTCSVVLGAFFLTWCPLLVVTNLTAHSHQGDYAYAFSLCMLLPAINAALDPLVYAIMRKDIRKGIHRLFYKTDPHVFTQVICD